MENPRVLLVENEEGPREAIRSFLLGEGYEVVCASAGDAARKILEREDFPIIITDLCMETDTVGDGLDLVRFAKDNHPDTMVIVLSGRGDTDAIEQALDGGAFDYVEKSLRYKRFLGLVLEKARLKWTLRAQAEANRRMLSRDMIGNSPALRRVMHLIDRYAATPRPVLITGESGSGKELVAQALRAKSGRDRFPFMSINAPAVPESLFEAEMFGIMEGVASQVNSRPGVFEACNNGVIFFDEIGDMPLALQVKILRVIDNQEVTRVGSTKTFKINVKIIAATNRNLEEMCENGTFRKDLFARLNVLRIILPNLDQRKDDVPGIAEHLLAVANQREGKQAHFTEDALEYLQARKWPLNIRELDAYISRAILLCPGPAIDRRQLLESNAMVEPDGSDKPSSVAVVKQAILNKSDLKRRVRELKRDALEEALARNEGNKSAAAKELGLHRNTASKILNRNAPPPGHGGGL